jgi:glycosyltransferase involved in cell wall biosynthesis
MATPVIIQHQQRHRHSSPLDSRGAIIVAGMPRSGKAVVAQALGWAGLFLGDDLRGPGRHNPEGYFEDWGMVRFHQELLQANDARMDEPALLRALNVPEEYQPRAAELLNSKYAGHSAWGWKDPRTTLFLDFWDLVLPHAHWLFVVRAPAQVAAAIEKRRDLERQAGNPLQRARIALRLWVEYNRRILEFVQDRPDRTLLLLAPDDLNPNGQALLNATILRQWQMPLRPLDLAAVFVPSMMQTTVPRWLAAWVATNRDVTTTLSQVHQLHQRQWAHLSAMPVTLQPSADTTKPPRPGRQVCLIAPRELEYSETFVRDHIRLLPAEVHVLYGGSRHGGSVWGKSGMRLLEAALNHGEFPNRLADGKRLGSVVGRALDMVLQHLLRSQKRPFGNRALRGYLRRVHADAVLAEFGQTGARVMTACAAADVPLVVHFHGSDIYTQKAIDRYLPRYQHMFSVAAAIVAVSGAMVERLAALGAPREKLFLNPCGVNTERFSGARPADAPPLFLAVGRFVEKKGPHLTLLAFQEVYERFPEARLWMMGDGPLLQLCQQIARSLALHGAVSFLGVRSHLEVAMAMRNARAFVQHSVHTASGDAEGTPLGVLEASCSGLPVVSTRHEGIKEAVLEGQTGFLVDEGDIKGMAAHMLELVQSPGLASALGQRGREHILANYSMDQRIAALAEVIEWAAEGQHG